MWKSQWLAQRWTRLIDRGDIDELVCDILRSEFFKRYAGRNQRSREHNMAGSIRATLATGLRHILSEILAKQKSLFRMTAMLRTMQVPTLILLGHRVMSWRSRKRQSALRLVLIRRLRSSAPYQYRPKRR